MIKNLVIVESPAKAKTIGGFLGKDFTVKSSFGHVRDLSKKQLGVDIENDFAPQYEISPDKEKIVKDLKKASREAELVWLASDEDREGEAISWHLVEALDLEDDKVKRIVFHEITKPAIVDAINKPRGIDIHLVDAQQARRVLDRLVGFELSPILWRKVKPSLSAGRVQSVAVRLIVEREEEINNFKPQTSYRVTARFYMPGDSPDSCSIMAELPKRFKEKEQALAFLKDCQNADFSVGEIETKPSKKSPAAPFTTSTLQQEASRKLGFSVSNTMRVAQQLYESGKITYMRTDSVNISGLAMAKSKEVIEKTFGKEYVKNRKYTTKTKGAQEAHEAIRPTYMDRPVTQGSAQEQKLYELIWKRTIASQMADALLEKTNVEIDISTSKEKFVARGEVIKFEGFLKVYLESSDDESQEQDTCMLPPLKTGQELLTDSIQATQKFSMPPPRYTEASLVKKLEELGIGRPSTYAPTISTIQKREYVAKSDYLGDYRAFEFIELKNHEIKEKIKKEKTGYAKGKLIPTDIGSLVNQFLMKHFDNIMDYNFTARVEKEFDEIARGLKDWNEMLREFYGPFHTKVMDTLENGERVKGERLLGQDPQTGKNIYVKIGRYGPMVQLGETDNDVKPRFAGLKKGQRMETITLDDALDLFKLPRIIGDYEGNELLISAGRFGPYVKHNNKFYSLAKTDDPLSIEKDRAIEIIEEKRKKERERIIKTFKEDAEVEVLNGRWGPYISCKKKNYKIPKDVDPKELTLEDCKKIIDEAPKTSGKTTRKTKKKTSK